MNYTFQRFLALLLLLAVLPLGLLIYAILFASLRSKAIFGNIRIGLNSNTFKMWKFTTMRSWPRSRFSRYLNLHPELKQEWQETRKLTNDPRLLPIGRFLRRFSLDELPQLWNVVRGEMALVGPRPIQHEENKRYGKYAATLHSVKPGLTGLWQVSGRNTLTYHRRIAINLYYVRHRSWKLDCWILYKTAAAVLGGRGAY